MSGRRLIEIERAPLVSGLRFANATSGKMAGLGFCDEESSSAMMMAEPRLRARTLQFGVIKMVHGTELLGPHILDELDEELLACLKSLTEYLFENSE